MLRKIILIMAGLLVILPACEKEKPSLNGEINLLPNDAQAISAFGDTLFSAKPAEKAVSKYNEAKENYKKYPQDPDALIWYGRRTAYLGKYREAINIYSEGIEKFPDDARLYRHRGHRFISIREFSQAIEDFKVAVKLIEGTEDQIEPDGMPNSRNIPVSSLHSNIWYHLGLAYYLKNDMENALTAYRKCRAVSNNPDNVVSSSHWLYMILRKLGREEEAAKVLEPIHKDMDIIENTAYYNLLLFYKGELSLDSLAGGSPENSSDAATAYGIGNYYFYNGNPEQAKQMYENILKSNQWAAFGYIAAETDLSRML